MSAEALSKLLDTIKQLSNNEATQYHKEKLQQKHVNVTRQCIVERDLLQIQNQFLIQINNEGKVRRSIKSKVLDTTRVMAWDDLDKVRTELVAKEKKKEEKKVKREVKIAKKEAKNVEKLTKNIAGTNKRRRKHKTTAAEAEAEVDADVNVSEPTSKSPRTDESLSLWEFRTAWVDEEQRIASIARMI